MVPRRPATTARHATRRQIAHVFDPTGERLVRVTVGRANSAPALGLIASSAGCRLPSGRLPVTAVYVTPSYPCHAVFWLRSPCRWLFPREALAACRQPREDAGIAGRGDVRRRGHRQPVRRRRRFALSPVSCSSPRGDHVRHRPGDDPSAEAVDQADFQIPSLRCCCSQLPVQLAPLGHPTAC